MGSFLLFFISFWSLKQLKPVLEGDEPFHILWSRTQGATPEHTLLSARILMTPDHTMCLDYTLSERKVIVNIKKTDEAHSRTESPEGQEERGGEDSDRRRGGRPRQQFKKLCMRSVPSRLTATLSPIPDIPEAAWLASGSEWLILEQHVLHSSNHLSQPQARQSTTSTTRQSFVPVNLHPGKKCSRISFT